MKSFALTLAVLFGTLGVAFAATDKPAEEVTEEITAVSEEVPADKPADAQ